MSIQVRITDASESANAKSSGLIFQSAIFYFSCAIYSTHKSSNHRQVPMCNLVRNSVVHSPSSVIRDPMYGNVSICSNCSFRISMRHAMPSLVNALVLSTLMLVCHYLSETEAVEAYFRFLRNM